jgi:hypothetical protein
MTDFGIKPVDGCEDCETLTDVHGEPVCCDECHDDAIMEIYRHDIRILIPPQYPPTKFHGPRNGNYNPW